MIISNAMITSGLILFVISIGMLLYVIRDLLITIHSQNLTIKETIDKLNKTKGYLPQMPNGSDLAIKLLLDLEIVRLEKAVRFENTDV